MSMVTSGNICGGSYVATSQPRENLASIMPQAWYSSLFGGTLSYREFPRGDILLGGNPIITATFPLSYPPYVGVFAQGGTSTLLGYNPTITHAFGGLFLYGGTYPSGEFLTSVKLACILHLMG